MKSFIKYTLSIASTMAIAGGVIYAASISGLGLDPAAETISSSGTMYAGNHTYESGAFLEPQWFKDVHWHIGNLYMKIGDLKSKLGAASSVPGTTPLQGKTEVIDETRGISAWNNAIAQYRGSSWDNHVEPCTFSDFGSADAKIKEYLDNPVTARMANECMTMVCTKLNNDVLANSASMIGYCGNSSCPHPYHITLGCVF